MTTYDPAADLAARFPGWRVVEALLPDDIDGYTEAPTRTVTIDRRLNAAARRSTLAHELVHIELGHDGPQSDAVEAAVDILAADRLLAGTEDVQLEQLRASAAALGVDTGTLTTWWRTRILVGAL